MAVAMEWVSRIITVSIEMVLPGVAGGWLDKRLGTAPLFTLAGFGLGITVAIWHLLVMTRTADTSGGPKHRGRDKDSEA